MWWSRNARMCGAASACSLVSTLGLVRNAAMAENGIVSIGPSRASLRSRGCRRAPLYCEMHHAGVAVGAIRQRQHVTGIDEVWVFDLRIDLPDLGPEPRVLEEHRGDVPERVAALHGVVHGRIGADELRGRRSRFPRPGASFSAATAASVAVRSSAVLALSGGSGRRRGRDGLRAPAGGADWHPASDQRGSDKGHEGDEPRVQNCEHARLPKLLIKRHPPLLNPGWGKRTPLL